MKSSISDKIRLQHILDSLNDILLFTKDIDYETYFAEVTVDEESIKTKVEEIMLHVPG
jgi:uncharacterized protein with HEPN domain